MQTKANNEQSLAIVIPFYKITYLKEALSSIAKQTCKNFKVYVGDDASPYSPLATISTFADLIEIEYYRFAENKGSSDLVGHWARCIKMADEADWIWLFSDDDVMSEDCVASFFERLRKTTETRAELFRFQSRMIGMRGETIAVNPPHPAWETVWEFLYHRLRGDRKSFMPDYIFSREVYLRVGLATLPAGWCADDLSWIRMGKDGGIFAVGGGRVDWRYSGENITAKHSAFRQAKVSAALGFLSAIDREAENIQEDIIELSRSEMPNWFIHQCASVGVFPPISSLGPLRTYSRISKQKLMKLLLRKSPTMVGSIAVSFLKSLRVYFPVRWRKNAS